MSATQSHEFHGYLLRPAGVVATDRLLARQWTEADPWHRDTVDPRFWLMQGKYCDSYLLADKQGPVFFWTGVLLPEHMTVEMHIQFPPFPEDRAEAHQLRKRVRAGLMIGMVWLERMLIRAGVKKVYFDTVNPRLAEFAVRHLKFAQDGPRLRRMLSPTPASEATARAAVGAGKGL